MQNEARKGDWRSKSVVSPPSMPSFKGGRKRDALIGLGQTSRSAGGYDCTKKVPPVSSRKQEGLLLALPPVAGIPMHIGEKQEVDQASVDQQIIDSESIKQQNGG